jgi:tetratricopeptide (TPR) repeat protein
LSAAFSPDGTRIITSSNNGTARIWDIVETGLLSIWAEKAQSCIVEGSDTPGTALICPLSEHKPFPTELVAYARSLTAAGDRAMYSRFWTIPHAYYQKSIFLLDQKSSSASTHGSNDELRRNVSTRIAIIDAIEDNIPEARRHLEPYAPETEVLLLEKLGSFAHEHLNNDAVALELLRRAHDLDPERESILVNLAEVYFATGQYQDFAHAASKANRPTATDDERVALAALTWAVSRLTRTSDYAKGQNLLRRYREIGNDTSINWSWKGTKHALAYGRHRYEEVKPILDVLALLEKPVTDQARAQLADLLQPHKPSGSQTK